MRRAARAAAGLALALTVLTACSSDGGGEPELTAAGAYIPEPITADMAGGFLVIENTGDADDTLTSVHSDLAESVEMHETVDNAMRPVDSFPVPAGGRLSLERGGSHLMLVGLSHQPLEGESVSLELRFEKSEPITLDVPVQATTYTGE
ncbi:copper chaperone PCu(A)C [Streptomyces sp. JH002]|uniref:copper chaperone PCu(A)C n=1 Tax=Streptomyces TaxID=1883 RepID=UPI001904F66E|nr:MULTISPECIES: copper chaperone PCu(A)C [unclassified Streptomyces]MCU4747922.1 copper chaperone PCu(A)C [Streptomyces sp. G-5]QQN78532.1 copper chaperone PCu(A)C [Streptomyces sp. XC 2026]